jgi:hypothetical protein
VLVSVVESGHHMLRRKGVNRAAPSRTHSPELLEPTRPNLDGDLAWLPCPWSASSCSFLVHNPGDFVISGRSVTLGNGWWQWGAARLTISA